MNKFNDEDEGWDYDPSIPDDGWGK